MPHNFHWLARLRGRRVVLIQHEWGGLHWLRRITYMPALLLADTIVMFSPLVRRELANDPVVGWTAKNAGKLAPPLPPNMRRRRKPPIRHCGGNRMRRGKAEDWCGSPFRVVILSARQPNVLLDIGAILKARGRKPLIVYIGSFIRGVDRVEHASPSWFKASDIYQCAALEEQVAEMWQSGARKSARIGMVVHGVQTTVAVNVFVTGIALSVLIEILLAGIGTKRIPSQTFLPRLSPSASAWFMLAVAHSCRPDPAFHRGQCLVLLPTPTSGPN